jgi:hypothetical protein
MSDIKSIKLQVLQIGKNAVSTAAQLNQLAANLAKNAAAINSAIGGTASGEDQKMVAAFQQASEAVKAAATSLVQAGQSADSWASNA